MNYSAISKVRFFIHPKEIQQNLSAKRFLLSCAQFRMNNLSADLSLETGEWLKDNQDPHLQVDFCNGETVSLPTAKLSYSQILGQLRPIAEKAAETLESQ